MGRRASHRHTPFTSAATAHPDRVEVTDGVERQWSYRTREAFLETGDAHGAVWTGLRQTAAAATGAAAVMVAAIIPSAMTDLLSVQVFGVGAAIAIVLDALVVRPVLLPAAASLLGRWSWWPLSREAPPPAAGRRGTTDPMRWRPRWRRTA
jgi:uncharacterized membrane protein YdfJ with MMPL/SSD domain